MATAKKAAAKRTLIEPHPGDKRYIRRDAKGRIAESDDVTRSLREDVRKPAKKVVAAGQGDRGDRKPATKKGAAKKVPAKKAPAKKAPAKTASAKKAPAKKATVKKVPAKKAPAKKPTAKK